MVCVISFTWFLTLSFSSLSLFILSFLVRSFSLSCFLSVYLSYSFFMFPSLSLFPFFLLSIFFSFLFLLYLFLFFYFSLPFFFNSWLDKIDNSIHFLVSLDLHLTSVHVTLYLCSFPFFSTFDLKLKRRGFLCSAYVSLYDFARH